VTPLSQYTGSINGALADIDTALKPNLRPSGQRRCFTRFNLQGVGVEH
jgi:hypothetical protein